MILLYHIFRVLSIYFCGVLWEVTQETAKTIPIIAMSANAFDDDMEKSRKAGMNAHIAKPIEPQQLYAVLDSFIGGLKL